MVIDSLYYIIHQHNTITIFLHCLFGYYYFTDAFKEWHTNIEIHVSAFLTTAFAPAPMIDIVPFTSMYKSL